ncbi:hypothetical protein BDW66DRAFT_153409 [Aspergillus desertorum]
MNEEGMPTYLSGTTRSDQQRHRPGQGSGAGNTGNMQANSMQYSNIQTRNMPASMSTMHGTTNMPGSGGHPHDMPEYVWSGEGKKIRNPMLRGVNPNTDAEMADEEGTNADVGEWKAETKD